MQSGIMSCQCSEIWRERYVYKKQARTDTPNPSSKLFLRASPNYDCDERFCYELLKAVFISIVCCSWYCIYLLTGIKLLSIIFRYFQMRLLLPARSSSVS